MADCDFCNLGDCVRRDAVRKFETVLMSTLKVLGYVCSVACGTMFGVGIADGITADGFNKVCADMYGNLYAIDNESIKYIKIAPHEEDGRYAEKHD